MSFHLTKLAMNADFKDDPVAKNVMIALCWSYFDGAPHALMNQEGICRRTSYKKRAVQEALARLKKDAPGAPFPASGQPTSAKLEERAYGLINVDYFGVGSGVSPRYTINEARLEAMQFPEQLSLKLTLLRAVEPKQKDAPGAPFTENQQNPAKDAPGAPFPSAKDAPEVAKGCATRTLYMNSHSSYNPSPLPEPTGAERGAEKTLASTCSRYSAKQWHAYTKSQPDINNPFAYVNSRINTTAYDSVLELWLEQQQTRPRQSANKNCDLCRGTGWEHVPGKGVKPCGCRAVAQTK